MTEKKPPTPTNNNSQKDVLQFLETFDTYTQNIPNISTNPIAVETKTEEDTQSVLDYIDQIVQTTTTNNNENNNNNTSSLKTNNENTKQTSEQNEQNETEGNGDVAWSWGNILASASTAYK